MGSVRRTSQRCRLDGCAATRWGGRAATMALLSLSVAGACRPEPEVETLGFALQSLNGCAIGRPDAIELQALGEFPPIVREFGPQLAIDAFDGLPQTTRELRVQTRSAGITGLGRRVLTPSTQLDVPFLILPLRSSCPVGDIAARANAGAAVAALASGGLLVAGGVDELGEVHADAFTFVPGDALVKLVPNGMYLRRTRASATVVKSEVVIAGGSLDVTGRAHENYEVFDDETLSFARTRGGHLGSARMDHAALLLDDGRLLLAGGRASSAGPALATAELLDLSNDSHEPVQDGLVEARIAPSLLRLDSGSVLLLGGHGAEPGEVVSTVERFDPAVNRFDPAGVTLPEHAEGVAAALPGARVAWVGCEAAAPNACSLSLLFDLPSGLALEAVPLMAASEPVQGLTSMRMLALDSGRLLLTGSVADPTANRRAFLIDLNQESIERLREVSRVPTDLISLRTGQVAELDAAGISLREQDGLSEFDGVAGNLVAPPLASVALDRAGHWQQEDAGLRARVDARLDLPKLRFAGLRAELDVLGGAQLLLLGDAGEPLVVELDAGRVRTRGCDKPMPDGASLIVVRDRERLTLRASTGPQLCALDVRGSLRLAVRAAAETTIRSFVVTRR